MLLKNQDCSSERKAPDARDLAFYAECDAIAGLPNPRFKQSSIYCSHYLQTRLKLVNLEDLTDAELDLTIF